MNHANSYCWTGKTFPALERGVIDAAEFVALQILGMVLVFFFPAIATWLPKAIGW